MIRLLEFPLDYLHRVHSIELPLHDLDLPPGVPRESALSCLNRHRASGILHSFGAACLLRLRIFNPVKKGLLHKNLAGVKEEALSSAEGLHHKKHGLLENAF